MSTTAEVTVETLRAVPDGIVIIGGGWAGLAAAVELARHGRKPVVLEAARTLGGRARSMRVEARVLNNGQHLLLGAYRSVLAILDTLEIPESRVLKRLALGLILKSTLGGETRLQTRALPAPLHLLWALATTGGLSLGARLSALQLLRRARRDRFDARPDVALTYYLRRCAQPAETIRALWQPLCQAALATPIERASTRLFLRVLRDVFFGRRAHSDLLVPIEPLVDCLPQPAADYVEARGGSVRVATRVQAIRFGDDGAVAGVQIRDQWLPARQIVLATPPETAAALLREHPACAALAQQLEHLELHPVSTLFLEFPETIMLPQALVGVLDGTLQWLVDHGQLGGTRGSIAAVVGGPGAHEQLTDDALSALLVADVARLYPDWPAPTRTHLVREKHAVLAATPENETLRPRNVAPAPGLWLAGDYTVAGYPSSLEAAVRSGIVAARRILREGQRRTR
jgi:squalene-associated FAD-dependent desaturase